MLNVIRTCPSRVRYCGQTVDDLIRSNNGSAHETLIISSNDTPNANGLRAIRAGLKYCEGQPFVFLEDDLAFINRFNDAAESFAATCAGSKVPFLPLCAAYKDELRACRGIAWKYPLRSFYGTQAFVITPDFARDFLAYCQTIDVPRRGFDLLIKEWAMKAGFDHTLTPYQCFIQHIGVLSSLHNGRFHHYATWPGPDWTWRTGAFSLAEQDKRPCDQPLAAAIAEWFKEPKSVAYDLGCSTGKYVQALRRAGVTCLGFDVTPGITREHVTELDLARPQTFNEKPGNVMCLEVAEHIHLENAESFLGNIKALCRDKLVLSWAVPGQGGRRHVNEQDAEWVTSLLFSKGFTFDKLMSLALRKASTLPWFKNSLYAFTRQKA